MEYFVEQAASYREAENRVRAKYGDHARVLTHRSVRIGGFLGLFSREGVELSGYLSSEPRPKAKPSEKRSLEEEKRKILEISRTDTNLDTVLSEIRSLKDSLSTTGTHSVHPMIESVRDLLAQNEFSLSFIEAMTERMRRELSVEELGDRDLVHGKVIQWVGESIRIHEPRSSGKPEILIPVSYTHLRAHET